MDKHLIFIQAAKGIKNVLKRDLINMITGFDNVTNQFMRASRGSF